MASESHCRECGFPIEQGSCSNPDCDECSMVMVENKTHPKVQAMSTKELERTIYDIMTDNGMDEEEADKKIDNMDRRAQEEYLTPFYDDQDDEEDKE